MRVQDAYLVTVKRIRLRVRGCNEFRELLLTVLALIVGMFRDPADPAKVIVGTKPELILAIITSVIGFLAGLVSPSPVASK